MSTEIWSRLNTRAEVVLLFALIRDFDTLTRSDFKYFEKHYAIDERRFGDALRTFHTMGLLRKVNRSNFEITDIVKKMRVKEQKK